MKADGKLLSVAISMYPDPGRVLLLIDRPLKVATPLTALPLSPVSLNTTPVAGFTMFSTTVEPSVVMVLPNWSTTAIWTDGLIVFPAIDLKDGQCVRLFKGDMQRATVFNDNPTAQARAFEAQGFRWLHVVDLDGAIAGMPLGVPPQRLNLREAGGRVLVLPFEDGRASVAAA